MGKINLAITGCMGRMGQQLIKSAIKDKSTKLVALTENRAINKKISGIKPELNTEMALSKANVIIDFTIPKCTFANVHFGIVKSIITFALLRAISVFNSGLIPLIFLLIALFSVRATNLVDLSLIADLMSC